MSLLHAGAGNMTNIPAMPETPALLADVQTLEAHLAEMATLAGSSASS
jgi:hypothetical protein